MSCEVKINHWGDKEWYKDSRLHRTDGPAIEYNTNIYWLDEYGNAILLRWYLHGREFSFLKWCNRLNMTDEEIVMYKLKYF